MIITLNLHAQDFGVPENKAQEFFGVVRAVMAKELADAEVIVNELNEIAAFKDVVKVERVSDKSHAELMVNYIKEILASVEV